MTDPNYTALAIVADRSGSMRYIAKHMNAAIRSLLEEQDSLPGKLLVDIVLFDEEVDHPYENVEVSQIDRRGIIDPRGMTALNDGIGYTIKRLGQRFAALPEEERPGQVIVAIVTDGMENSSYFWTREQVGVAIKEHQEKYSWKFLFLGANIDSAEVANSLFIPKEQAVDYTANAAGTASVLRSASAYIGATRSGVSANFTEEDRSAAVQ